MSSFSRSANAAISGSVGLAKFTAPTFDIAAGTFTPGKYDTTKAKGTIMVDANVFANEVMREYGLLKEQTQLNQTAAAMGNTKFAAVITAHYDAIKEGIKALHSTFVQTVEANLSIGETEATAVDRGYDSIESALSAIKKRAEVVAPLAFSESMAKGAKYSV